MLRRRLLSKMANNRARTNWYNIISRRYVPRGHWRLFLLLVLLLVAAVLTVAHKLIILEIWRYCPNGNIDWKSEVVKAKCEIPTLNLWDPTIINYLKAENPTIECAKDYPLIRMTWTPDSPSILELTERGHKEMSHLKCIYQLVTRNNDDKTLEYGNEHGATFPIEMPGELVQIKCQELSNGAAFYTDVFGTIVPVKHDANVKKKWNVIVVGIDSVSRQSFIRFLPETFRWLKNMVNDGFYVFDAYHKIGENTFPNLVPMLTGRKVELSSSGETLQLPHPGQMYAWVERSFDSYPFIWQDFANHGYATGYVEDDPPIATFNMMRRGFNKQPTDHYGRTMFLAFEKNNKENEVNPSRLAKKNTSSIPPNYFCFNGRKKFEVLWNYSVKQFISRYSEVAPTFMFSWVVQLTHEWLTTLKQADQPLLNTLQFLVGQDAPWRNNTFVFLLSDHGQRVDKIRSTFVGRLEDRLPFLAIFVPPTFKEKYPNITANLAKNRERLVTALDIYATWKHILHLSTASGAEVSESDDFADVGPSGYAKSLFNKINPLRSCSDAGIPDWYCACYRYVELSATCGEAISASNAISKAIGKDLEEGISKGLCANLSVARVEQIRRVEFAKSARSYTAKCRLFGLIKEAADVDDVFDEYVVQITMTPGGGKFEATVRNHSRNGLGWSLIGGVERVNRYGTQSACLPNSLERLRKTCFCL